MYNVCTQKTGTDNSSTPLSGCRARSASPGWRAGSASRPSCAARSWRGRTRPPGTCRAAPCCSSPLAWPSPQSRPAEALARGAARRTSARRSWRWTAQRPAAGLWRCRDETDRWAGHPPAVKFAEQLKCCESAGAHPQHDVVDVALVLLPAGRLALQAGLRALSTQPDRHNDCSPSALGPLARGSPPRERWPQPPS